MSSALKPPYRHTVAILQTIDIALALHCITAQTTRIGLV